MIIDFHTHVFPDSLAAKALSVLVANARSAGSGLSPVSDATVGGLVNNMDGWGIDVSVIQPVVTKPSQMKSTNEWAAAARSDRIVSFGGISPQTDDYRRDIDFVAELGLKGLKFHAEYQNYVIDDDRMLNVYDYALSKGLILLFHAGADIGMPPPYKSSPKQFARIARAMQGGVIVAAHLGGYDQWDEVEEHLVGEDVYLDTSMGFEYFSQEQFLRIVHRHGADRILFASDAPWSNAGTEVERLCAMPLAPSEKDAILGGNAKRLLGL